MACLVFCSSLTSRYCKIFLIISYKAIFAHLKNFRKRLYLMPDQHESFLGSPNSLGIGAIVHQQLAMRTSEICMKNVFCLPYIQQTQLTLNKHEKYFMAKLLKHLEKQTDRVFII